MEKLYILKTGKGLQNTITNSDIELIREEVDVPQVNSLFFSGTTNKTLEISFTDGSTITSNAFADLDTKVTAVSVTGTTTKTLTITNSDATTVSTTFTDETGSGSVVVDTVLSESSTNPLENQVIESALDAVSTNVSSQVKYMAPGKAIQFTIHPTVLTTNDATAVPYGDDLVFVTGNTDRYLLIRTTNTSNPDFINNFFSVPNKKVLVRTQRNSTVPSEPLLNYEERLSYAVFNTTPSTELSNVDAEYTEYKLDTVLSNFQVGVGQVTLAQGAFVNMSFFDSQEVIDVNAEILLQERIEYQGFSFDNTITYQILPIPGRSLNNRPLVYDVISVVMSKDFDDPYTSDSSFEFLIGDNTDPNPITGLINNLTLNQIGIRYSKPEVLSFLLPESSFVVPNGRPLTFRVTNNTSPTVPGSGRIVINVVYRIFEL